jgi:uncharacterized protein (DUF302 family)
LRAQVGISYTVESSRAVPDVVESITQELKKRGYGVLSNIDVKKIIKEKLGEDMSSYVILDVCNPRHAKRAIDAHNEVGLILPCKIMIYEDSVNSKRKTVVSLYKPSEAIKVLGFEDLRPLAEEVERDLVEAVDAVAA